MRQHPDWLALGQRLRAAASFRKSILRRRNLSPGSSSGKKTGRPRWTCCAPRPVPTVQELLRCRALTGTTLFTPSQSASGQAFDVAVTICGLLVEEGRLTTGLSENIFKLASAANRGGSSQPLEQVLMDLMSLGRRFNWDQLVAFTGRIEDAGDVACPRRPGPRCRRAVARAFLRRGAFRQAGGGGEICRAFSPDRVDRSRLQPPVRRGRGERTAGARPVALPHRFPLAPGGGLQPAAAVAGLHAEMAGLSGEWISAGGVAAFCAAGRIVPGTTAAGARVPCGPREFVCAGFPAGGVASERAVSRPGHTERGVCLSTARAHDGPGGPGRIRPQSSQPYEQHDPAHPAAVLRAAGADLHRLPREAGGNPPAERPAAHEAQAARKRRPPVRRRPVPGLRRHHHLADPRLDGGHQIQPDGRLLVHVLRHHLRVRV